MKRSQEKYALSRLFQYCKITQTSVNSFKAIKLVGHRPSVDYFDPEILKLDMSQASSEEFPHSCPLSHLQPP